MREKLKGWLKMLGTVFGVISVIIGFIASVAGIASWVGITSLHWGNVIIPNPIIIVLSVLIAIILVAAAFYLGGMYVLYLLFSLLAYGLAKLGKIDPKHINYVFTQDEPVATGKTEKESESNPVQVQTIQAE